MVLDWYDLDELDFLPKLLIFTGFTTCLQNLLANPIYWKGVYR